MPEVDLTNGCPPSVTLGREARDIIVEKPRTDMVIVPVSGPPGPRGAAGGDVYTHVQTIAQTTWTINHDLGRDPVAVQVMNASGEVVEEWNIQFTIPNEQIRLGYDIAFSGKARLI